ncbi:hypothetical protein GQ53DRAFT_664789 [Thozetella sp. PMI_491]|nr:hypothetical protein GQ53DRAFT_664789 [Thozetella sp. PMI_491]
MGLNKRGDYVYTDLPAVNVHGRPWIRLMRILSLSTDKEPVNVELQPFQVTDDTNYDCISYTWGDPICRDLTQSGFEEIITGELNRTIHCHGRRLPVTQNLVDALEQLGKSGYAPDENRWLWYESSLFYRIDAICINQQSDQEKCRQVPLMGRIYKQARQVIIWLGRDDLHSQYARPVLDILSSPLVQIPAAGTSFVSLNDEALLAALFGHSYPQNNRQISDQEWISYCAFLQRLWFGRMWVLQESFFARSRRVLLGDTTIPWESLERSADLIHATNLSGLLKDLVRQAVDPRQHGFIGQRGTDPREFDNRLNNQHIFHVLRRDASSALTLSQILYHARYFSCSKPKDYIYGVLGLWDEAQVGKHRTYTITPDYDDDRCPLSNVYAEATWFSIIDASNLDVLGLVEDPLSQNSQKERGANWPSWVPAYNKGMQMIPLYEAEFGQGRDNLQANRPWDASRGLNFQGLRLGTQWASKLPAEGILVDCVSLLGPTYRNTVVFGLYSLLDFLLQYPVDMPYPSDENESPPDALRRTMIKDTYRGHCPSSLPGNEATARAGFHAFLARLVRELQQEIINQAERVARANIVEAEDKNLQGLKEMMAYTKDQITELSERFSSPYFPGSPAPFPSYAAILQMIALESQLGDPTPEETAQQRLHVDFDQAFRVACGGRRLFLTKSGYFGVAPESVRMGDEVYVLAGAAVPFVLRRLEGGPDNQRRIVGEAYVYGVMGGERVRGNGTEAAMELLLV